MQRQQSTANKLSPSAAPLSAAMLGGTLASVLWAVAWVGVAAVAVHSAVRSLSGFAVLGAVVAVLVSAAGCVVAWGVLHSDHRWANSPTAPESLGRRIGGWFAALVWCGVGAAWNFGVFGWLFRAAAEGRGLLLTILVLWSLIGWLLLNVLFVSLGSIVDWIIGAGA
jgi:hypothetical protein